MNHEEDTASNENKDLNSSLEGLPRTDGAQLVDIREEVGQAVAVRPSATTIVLQWLTYVFWGWLTLALVWLMGVITSSMIAEANVGDSIAYVIAATVVLLPTAVVTDILYRRRDPIKESGSTTLVTVIHAVIFALITTGAVVGTVFIVLSMILGVDGESKASIAALVTGLFAIVLYTALVLRTLSPPRIKKLTLMYGFAMIALSIILLAIGAFGPMAKAFSERQDRRIEQHLYGVQRGIESYVADNNKLPESLSDVEYVSDEAEALVEDDLVSYEKVDSSSRSGSGASSFFRTSYLSAASYRYELCVEYKNEANQDDDYRSMQQSQDDYSSYLSTYSHPAGEVCYKLSVSGTISTSNNNSYLQRFLE